MTQLQVFAKNENLDLFVDAIDSSLELGVYEKLWCQPKASFRSIATQLANEPNSRPSDFVSRDEAQEVAQRVLDKLRSRVDGWFNLCIHDEKEYPERLREAEHPVELLYYQGWWELVDTRSIVIIGSRRPSDDGIRRVRKLTVALVNDHFTAVSGLAEGIDRVANETAITKGGQTIAVIGTPLGYVYPKSNTKLQEKTANEFLLISQVPVECYESQNPKSNRFFFPERNKIMSALIILFKDGCPIDIVIIRVIKGGC